MALFEEVLGWVQKALSGASSWEIKDFLEALVELQVISRDYGSSLRASLSPGPSSHQTGADLAGSSPREKVRLGKVSGGDPGRTVSLHQLNTLQGWLELERGPGLCQNLPQRHELDRWRDMTDRGMENEEGWTEVEKESQGEEWMGEMWMREQRTTEKTEEMIRRIALPLWQHWERAQWVLWPLLAWMNTTTDRPTDMTAHTRSVIVTTDSHTESRTERGTHTHHEEEENKGAEEEEGEHDEHEEEEGEIDTSFTVAHLAETRMPEGDDDLPSSLLRDYGDQLLKDMDTIDIHSLFDEDFKDIFNFNLLELPADGEANNPTALSQPHGLMRHGQSKNKRKGRKSGNSAGRTVGSVPKRRRTEDPGMVVQKKTEGDSPSWGSAGLDPVQPGVRELPSPSPTDLHLSPPLHVTLQPPVQLVTLPDSPGYQLVHAGLDHSPQLLRIILSPTTTPTYILVPAASPSPTTTAPIIPLSPVNGALAPVHMGSSPQGSLSDCTSKALFPMFAFPQSPKTGASPRRDSPSPPSSPVPTMPECVTDYLQKAKAHIRELCQEMEPGLRLDSHYVDVRLVEKQILINGSKSPEKELVVVGDMERNLGWLGRSQMFQNTVETKAKRYIVLLGNAGMGKSTLVKKLCMDWSSGSFPQFDFMFLLDGKALALTEHTYSLQSLLFRLSFSAPHCHAPEAVFTQVLSAPERVLLVLDGFDRARDFEGLLLSRAEDFRGRSRVQSYTVKQLYSGLLQRRLLADCSLLLCVRDRGVGSQLLRRADSLLELCGFSSPDIWTYMDQYFTEPSPRAAAMERLQNHKCLLSLCWNPALCRAVCFVLEHHCGSETLPSTLSELWSYVLRLRLKTIKKNQTQNCKQAKTGSLKHNTSLSKKRSVIHKDTYTNKQTNRNPHIRTRSHSQIQIMAEEEGVEECAEDKRERPKEGDPLSQMSSLAWEGLKSHSSVLSLDHTISDRLRRVGLECGLVHTHSLRGSQWEESEREKESQGQGGVEEENERNRERKGTDDIIDDHILSWAHSFLQGFLGGAHLALSKAVSDRCLLPQTLPSQPRGRRRTQGEGLDLAQRFAVGLLFQNKEELQKLVSLDAVVMDTVIAKRGVVRAHLEGLNHGDLSPAQLLEVCHCVHETGDGRLTRHLVKNLPEVLSFYKVPLHPHDSYVVWNLLGSPGTQGRGFCLVLEDTGVRICGLKALVGLSNVSSFRACIADTIALWEELEKAGEAELLRGAVNKLLINPFKASQVCHIDHLTKLVHIHQKRRLTASQSESVFGEGVPAVRDLYKLEYGLGPVKGPLALPKLLEVLPTLHSLQHLDLENSKMRDLGAEDLAKIITSLSSLQILNLAQNCIGDQGAEKLAAALCTLPSLHSLSLYLNLIADAGAESLAAVLPQMSSLTDLDVKYNKFTDVGAQHLASSLRNCPWIKSLGMWNECIPYREFERLQKQDFRIHSV